MIITLTANPSLDRTVELSGPLQRGGVQRAGSASAQAAGKGVNVSTALAAAGVPTLAVLPGDPNDPVVLGLAERGLDHVALPVGQPLRSNITLAEPDGTTTKVNEPGPVLSPEQQRDLGTAVVSACRGAAWLVLAGSLPPGVPAAFYAELTVRVRDELGPEAPLVALDTSGDPLRAVFAAGRAAAPDLAKPNAEELAELTGTDEDFEADPARAAAAAAELVARGTGAVLATLGGRGAVLATAAGAWHGTHPPVAARSTVGAGDSSLAGYLIAHSAGADAPGCLAQAVAHGAAAVSLPGSTIPVPEQTTPGAVGVAVLRTTTP
ncbi:1-phosphofructokinase family hexose kinase [Zafaria sp. Z1313]|uniref:1-phosphofructokinase family hexose kinase n=1 Tax=unclassified Zafaria TaxID=2828765 RepID=UPI002E76D11D|nr:hexose kinase [Zafaria sp. J156]MEE1621598.1 hexose kinase [Zafaria sp. J156]